MAPTRSASRSRPWQRRAATSSSAPSRVEGYRNFATKLWNAARFAEINACVPVKGFDPASAKQTINRWIAGESERALATVTEALEAYRFNEAAGAIYSFIWHKFCDWYLELIKPILSGVRSGRRRGDARHDRLGARPRAQAAPSLHALRHRGAVGEAGAPKARGGRASSSSPPGRNIRAWRTPRPTPRSAGSSGSSRRCARCARR